jgi:hypothetical protein
VHPWRIKLEIDWQAQNKKHATGPCFPLAFVAANASKEGDKQFFAAIKEQAMSAHSANLRPDLC